MLMVILHPKNVQNNYSTCKVSKFNRECAKQSLLFVQSTKQYSLSAIHCFGSHRQFLGQIILYQNQFVFGADAEIIIEYYAYKSPSIILFISSIKRN